MTLADVMKGSMTVLAITLLVVMCLMLLAMVVGLIWRRAGAKPAPPEEAPEPKGHAFPVIVEPPDPPARPVREIGTGPGNYRVVGVVRSTGTDTKMHLYAESPANAKVKAELRGVIVTDIEKE